MKGKIPLYIAIIAMLVLSAIAVNFAFAYPAPNRIYLDPSEKKYHTDWGDGVQQLGDQFTVDVVVENVSATGQLRGADFKIYYNTSILDVVSVTTAITYSYQYDKTNDTIGKVWAGGVLSPYLSGDVTIFSVTFNVSDVPAFCQTLTPPENVTFSCPLTLNETELVDKDAGIYVGYNEESGYYEYARDCQPVGAPEAKFTVTPPVPYECTDVALDASASTHGGAPPLIYQWIITNGTGSAHLIGPDNTVTTTFHCDGAGTVNVTLVVTNNLTLTHQLSKIVDQLALIGCILDVYTGPYRFCNQTTPNIGMGNWTNADAFAPGDWVWIYTNVSYNGAPVNHLLVAFEVLFDPDNLTGRGPQCMAYRVAETNKTGTAVINFRIPVPCENDYMGKWLVIATAKVQDVKQEDQLRFDVGWILEIVEAWTTFEDNPETVFYRKLAQGEAIDFHVKIKNIMWVSKNVTIIIVVYDECHVPLGQVIATKSISGGEYCSPHIENISIIETISVPQWAYIGAGKVYYNIFTALPRDCGIAYSPEFSTDIVIKYGTRP